MTTIKKERVSLTTAVHRKGRTIQPPKKKEPSHSAPKRKGRRARADFAQEENMYPGEKLFTLVFLKGGRTSQNRPQRKDVSFPEKKSSFTAFQKRSRKGRFFPSSHGEMGGFGEEKNGRYRLVKRPVSHGKGDPFQRKSVERSVKHAKVFRRGRGGELPSP